MVVEDIELLAPAGSFDALIAAVQNGANAVYLGGQRYGARAFAHNFDYEDLKRAVEYCHLRNVKLYVTVNTLYDDKQIAEMLSYIDYLYEINVDALIIQDMGLVNIVKDNYPDFEIHMSTQTSVRNYEGARFFEKNGIDRVVLAREMKIDEISNICKKCNIDIEVFVHGALCMSYSGQCLMSSMIAKRSGNKGECGQPCRLPYELYEDGKKVNTDGSYLLSPRDLCSIENVDKLIQAGIKSFKIEGRMKRPEYVGEVIRAYRKAIDAYFARESINIDESILNMKKVFNRGFTGGFLFNDSLELAKVIPGNQGIKIGSMINYSKGKLNIKLSDILYQGDRIYFPDDDFTRTITKLYKEDSLVNSGQKGEIVSIELDKKVKIQDLYKVIDSKIVEKNERFVKQENVKLPITMHLRGNLYSPLTLDVFYNDYYLSIDSETNIDLAKKQPLTEDRIKEQMSKLGNTTFVLDTIIIDFPSNGIISIKELNNLRRKAIEKLESIILSPNRMIGNNTNLILENAKKEKNKKIAIQVSDIKQLANVRIDDIDQVFIPFKQYSAQNDKYIPYIPYLYNENDLLEFINSNYYKMCKYVQVNDFGALNLIGNKAILGYHFNTYNSYAAREFDLPFILSYELSKLKINKLNCNKDVYFTAYSQIVNMNLKHCLISDYHYSKKIKGCNQCKKHTYCINDRMNKKFKVITDEYCNNYVLHCDRLYYDKLNDLNVDYILLNFIDESSQEIEEIVNDYKLILKGNRSVYKTNYDIFNGYYND